MSLCRGIWLSHYMAERCCLNAWFCKAANLYPLISYSKNFHLCLSCYSILMLLSLG